MEFFDREKEVALLREVEALSGGNAQFTVLTGRRRIGKTTLVFKAYEEKPLVYLFASRKAEKDLCSGFVKEIEVKLGIPMIGGVDSFSDVFEYLMKISIDRQITVFIDEFQDFKFVNPSIFNDMQRIWDLYKGKSKINLIVGGSINSLMNEIFRDSKQPLYQRETRFIKLNCFAPSEVKRDPERFKPKLLEEKINNFLRVNSRLSSFAHTSRCLSMEDM